VWHIRPWGCHVLWHTGLDTHVYTAEIHRLVSTPLVGLRLNRQSPVWLLVTREERRNRPPRPDWENAAKDRRGDTTQHVTLAWSHGRVPNYLCMIVPKNFSLQPSLVLNWYGAP